MAGMVGFQLSYTVDGLPEVEELLRRLPRQFANNAMRSALSKATTPVLREVKRRVPVEKGVTKAAVSRKVTTSKRTGRTVVLIGIDKRKIKRDDPGGGKAKFVRPANIASLLEFGTKFAQPYPFLRPALDATRRETEEIFATAMIESILREVQKYEAHALKKIATRRAPRFALSPSG